MTNGDDYDHRLLYETSRIFNETVSTINYLYLFQQDEQVLLWLQYEITSLIF